MENNEKRTRAAMEELHEVLRHIFPIVPQHYPGSQTRPYRRPVDDGNQFRWFKPYSDSHAYSLIPSTSINDENNLGSSIKSGQKENAHHSLTKSLIANVNDNEKIFTDERNSDFFPLKSNHQNNLDKAIMDRMDNQNKKPFSYDYEIKTNFANNEMDAGRTALLNNNSRQLKTNGAASNVDLNKKVLTIDTVSILDKLPLSTTTNTNDYDHQRKPTPSPTLETHFVEPILENMDHNYNNNEDDNNNVDNDNNNDNYYYSNSNEINDAKIFPTTNNKTSTINPLSISNTRITKSSSKSNNNDDLRIEIFKDPNQIINKLNLLLLKHRQQQQIQQQMNDNSNKNDNQNNLINNENNNNHNNNHNNNQHSNINHKSNKIGKYRSRIFTPSTPTTLGKRGPECMRRCILQGLLHPVQCHSLC